MCIAILVVATGFTYGLARVNGYCESGNLNPFKSDRVRTDTYGLTEQKLVATATLQYFDEDIDEYVTQGSKSVTKNYGESGGVADTGWYESNQDDGFNIRNSYYGAIYNSDGTINFSLSDKVYE